MLRALRLNKEELYIFIAGLVYTVLFSELIIRQFVSFFTRKVSSSLLFYVVVQKRDIIEWIFLWPQKYFMRCNAIFAIRTLASKLCGTLYSLVVNRRFSVAIVIETV